MRRSLAAVLVAVALSLGVFAQKPKKKPAPKQDELAYPSWSSHSTTASAPAATTEGVSLRTLREFPERYSGRIRVDVEMRFWERKEGQAGEYYYFQLENETGTIGGGREGRFVFVTLNSDLATAITDRRYPDTSQRVTFDMHEFGSDDSRYKTSYRCDIVSVEFIDDAGAVVATIR